MKSMVVMLCAVLWLVSVVVAQESDWLSGTWKGMRKLESASQPNFRQRQALNSPGSETVLHLQYNPATKLITGRERRRTYGLPITTLPKRCSKARSSMGTRGYSFCNNQVV